jgi:putative oxidoreductase
MSMRKLFQTDESKLLFFQRLVLGAVILPHGLQKTLGWFGGYGFSATIDAFANYMHIPAPLAVLVILGESLGALGLIFGAFTRVGAFGIIASMLGAIFIVHAPHGFFMNWTGQGAGEGIEYHLLVLALALPLLVKGAGAYSIDGAIAHRLSGPRASGVGPRPEATLAAASR